MDLRISTVNNYTVVADVHFYHSKYRALEQSNDNGGDICTICAIIRTYTDVKILNSLCVT